ncbi:MAG TPA: helix-turn-helix transcriptional regulator [Polyangiaceae bacterium]
MTINITEVPPIGTREVVGFWDGRDEHDNPIGGYGPVKLPEYPPHPKGKALRALRVGSGVSARVLANHVGVKASVIYGLENGRHTTDDEGWSPQPHSAGDGEGDDGKERT